MKFKLLEKIELLKEVYPNKGESKKDFISRFMSITKDEYPDVKQRYAVANSYWERRNKKKNESVNDSVDVVAYHGSQDDNISLRDEPIYLTNNIDLAKDFAKGYAFGYHLLEDDSPTVYKMRVTFNNPLIIHTEEEYEDIMDIVNIEKTVSMLKERGNDGVIFRDEEADYYMPISAKNQCKILDKIEMIND